MTRYHDLTPAELGAIGSGSPDAAVIETLLSGQYSKRLIMIKAILTEVADQYPAEHARLETAYRLLTAVQQTDRALVRAILTHSSVGPWAVRCLRALRSPSSGSVPLVTDLGQLAAIAAAAAIRAGQPFAIEVPVRGRTVMLPTLGLATLDLETLAGPDAVAFATVRHDDDYVYATITVGRHRVQLPADPSTDGPGWQGLRSLGASYGGISIRVEFDDLDPGRDYDGAPLAGRQTGDEVAAWQATLRGAWETLVRHHPHRARALAAGLRCIMPLNGAGPDGMSVTDAASFGALVLTPPRDPLAFAETLVHEFQHSVLSAVTDLASLHTAGPDPLHYSPWREDPRPIEGLLQGAYAYLGVTGYWETQRRVVTGRQQALADFEFARWRQQIRATAQTLLESGMLTDTGTTLVQDMAATAEHWRDLPVADEPRRLAERAVNDHWVRWRLRNRHPASVAITAIASAWQSERPWPGCLDAIPMTVLPQQRRLALGGRIRLFYLRLADPGRFHDLCANPSLPGETGAAVSEADLAYAGDDLERAADGYRIAIQAEPSDIDMWSGLVLTSGELRGWANGIASSPEIARAAYLEILERTGTGPDLCKLEEWLEAYHIGVES